MKSLEKVESPEQKRYEVILRYVDTGTEYIYTVVGVELLMTTFLDLIATRLAADYRIAKWSNGWVELAAGKWWWEDRVQIYWGEKLDERAKTDPRHDVDGMARLW